MEGHGDVVDDTEVTDTQFLEHPVQRWLPIDRPDGTSLARWHRSCCGRRSPVGRLGRLLDSAPMTRARVRSPWPRPPPEPPALVREYLTAVVPVSYTHLRAHET